MTRYGQENTEGARRGPALRPSLLPFSDEVLTEVSRYFTAEHKIIIPLTVREILDEHIAQKLA